MPQLELRYYAQLRDQARISTERVETGATSPASLYEQLRERHGFSLPASLLKVAVNARFCGWDQPLRDGDTVVFIPPVNGG
ncbi:MoaD/ThiS family protein [Stenotrophomonas oahuensis]|uniref:MoaD/ThiS family protein n=1 Tax=Stenotrophomonas oahuensis TaxID=3003271 RepID=A0ABY9YNG9_9GAMM|nr:MoaD/ThiS family protein [Stenotrophomonas sp. A5586]WNH52170.1 MoaD/ThiS family protein [Stenotrophomonas sp. A5586]